MASSSKCIAALLVPHLLAVVTNAGEMAFVDVASDDKIDLTTLDVPVAYARGINNFFTADPMYTHDWADLSDVRKILDSVIGLDKQRAGPAKIKEYEDLLAPTYAALPHTYNGLLDSNAARYALYRLFDQKHGWQLKGVEPAGGSWLGTVEMDPSVKQTSKYMVPTVLIEDILEKAAYRQVGLNLHQLAIVALTMETAIRSEILYYLYKIYRTLELPIPGKRAEAEIKDILSTYLMVYAFGVNLDATTLTDVRRSREQLDQHQLWWRDLLKFVEEELKGDMVAARGAGLDFYEVLNVTLRMGDHYSAWQRRDCTRAKDVLKNWSELKGGRVPFADWGKLPQGEMKPLFIEEERHLRTFGIMDDSRPDAPQVIVPNWLVSKSMCLTTASYYMVCCPNECEMILDQLRTVRRPSVAPDEVKYLLAKLAKPAPENLAPELHDIAAAHGGSVPLHSISFARWLHRAYPFECPSPNSDERAGSVLRGPKTANEWLQPKSDEKGDIRQMGTEVAGTLRTWEQMDMGDKTELISSEDDAPELVLKFKEEAPLEETPDGLYPILASVMMVLRTAAFCFMFLSVLGLMCAAVAWIAGIADDGKPMRMPKWKDFVNDGSNV